MFHSRVRPEAKSNFRSRYVFLERDRAQMAPRTLRSVRKSALRTHKPPLSAMLALFRFTSGPSNEPHHIPCILQLIDVLAEPLNPLLSARTPHTICCRCEVHF